MTAHSLMLEKQLLVPVNDLSSILIVNLIIERRTYLSSMAGIVKINLAFVNLAAVSAGENCCSCPQNQITDVPLRE